MFLFLLPELLLIIIFISAAIFNDREFHNIYRYSRYEEFIRSKYPSHLGVLADFHIDRHKDTDHEKSNSFFEKAESMRLKNENEKALRNYNICIDYDPDKAEYIYQRGVFKLTRLEIDRDMAYSAIKDFDRALRLNPQYTFAHFHKSIALGYLHKYAPALIHARQVWNADSTLNEKSFSEKYGISRENFSKQFSRKILFN
jgi:tetratricopeptide (TPR) repeat protein